MIENQTLTIARSIADIRGVVSAWRARGLSVGVVPTMGSLHAGHLALVARARAENDRVLATIFVNPLQFGPGEDFASYPRDNERDFALLREHRCDAVFAPPVSEMFPAGRSVDGAATQVSVPALAGVLCGASRPGHFDGVATIVLKLLMIALPDSAYFGEKDYQQLTIVQQLVHDLSVPVRIAGVPIVREFDGLALSSRNVYLDAREREIAPSLYRVLRAAADRLGPSAATNEAVLTAARSTVLAGGFERLDYLTLAASRSLETLGAPEPGARLFAAAWLGRTRLIDNIPVGSAAPECQPVGRRVG